MERHITKTIVIIKVANLHEGYSSQKSNENSTNNLPDARENASFQVAIGFSLNLIGRESGASFLSRRSFGIALVLDYLAVRLIQKTRATFSTSQIQS